MLRDVSNFVLIGVLSCFVWPNLGLQATGAAELGALSAVRCGDHKVYWLIDGTSSTALPKGIAKTGTLSLDSPVIFDLSTDWSEETPLEPSSPAWASAKSAAEAARLAHLATLTPAPNQMNRGSAHHAAICADPASQKKHPGMANCTISPANWAPPICLEGGSIGSCIGQQKCAPGCRFVNCSSKQQH